MDSKISGGQRVAAPPMLGMHSERDSEDLELPLEDIGNYGKHQ